MLISRKIYFLTDPGVTAQHEIVITESNGVTITTANELILDVKSVAEPDASAGLGVVFRVMVDRETGAIT